MILGLGRLSKMTPRCQRSILNCPNVRALNFPFSILHSQFSISPKSVEPSPSPRLGVKFSILHSQFSISPIKLNLLNPLNHSRPDQVMHMQDTQSFTLFITHRQHGDGVFFHEVQGTHGQLFFLGIEGMRRHAILSQILE
ncbi:MAG: hypothetical protein PWP64_940 [Candidatus Cloacimonadota bacterium]|nr:hypothetical protein [Candidatus Cloacimonadota bacterium]